jgi:spermidine synthase
MTRWSHPSLAATRDTPYGRVSAEERQGLVTVFDNDALAFDTEGTDAEEFVHLAAVEHAAPRRILVLGGAASGVVAQALLHGPERLDAVELDEVFFRLVEPLLPAAARQALASPMVMLNFTDPRAFLEASTVPYDLVLVAMPEPASAATNRYYTREFFELVARHLAPGGVLALRLPAAENLWTPALTRRSASVERALRAAFADVLALPGSRLLLLASAQRLERDPSVLAERLRARVSSPRAATPEYLRFLHTNDRKDEIAALLAASDASPNTDLQPICFRHAAVLWLSRVSPALAARVEQVREGSLAPWIALGLCAAMLLACRIRRRARALGVIALAGFAGMVLETGLLLIYQSRCGVLFEDLGLLLTAFMAGLALGAWAIPDVPKPWTAAALLIALSGLCAAIAALAAHPSALGLFGTGAILACAGSLCGALFAVASRKEQTRWPYAADLLGGCVGAALASLFFFPLLGLSLCAAALVPLALLGLVLAV